MHSGWSVAALSVLEGAKNRDPTQNAQIPERESYLEMQRAVILRPTPLFVPVLARAMLLSRFWSHQPCLLVPQPAQETRHGWNTPGRGKPHSTIPKSLSRKIQANESPARVA
jgi:hypothetical protein